MFRHHDLVPSAPMGRPMHVWRFGHFGLPILVFPSASGMAHEWEAHGMIEALSDLLEEGRIKLYCTESNVAEAWTRREEDAASRIRRHIAYERYVLDELVPRIREDCRVADIRVSTTGTSLGAYYAANFLLKQPRAFDWALCLSGRYDIGWLTDASAGADLYFNNPMSYVPNLHGDALEHVRQNVELTLVCGRGKWEDGNIEDMLHFSEVLAAKGIRHEQDLWGHDVSHQWEWWRRQARLHILKRLALADARD